MSEVYEEGVVTEVVCTCGGSGHGGFIDTKTHASQCPKHEGYRVKFFRPAQKHYSLYVQLQCDSHGDPIYGTEKICHFGDSATILGIRIGGKLLLSENEAEEQIERWNEPDGVNRIHFYSLYRPDLTEAGTTPPLPGMSDREIAESNKIRFPAPVGHVVGQGGICWCGEHHLNSLPGDPVFGGNMLHPTEDPTDDVRIEM